MLLIRVTLYVSDELLAALQSAGAPICVRSVQMRCACAERCVLRL